MVAGRSGGAMLLCMLSVVILVLLVLAVYAVVTGIRRSRTIVARRGLSIGADLGTLADRPRVVVREVTAAGPGRVRLVLAPEGGSRDGDAPAELDLVVSLQEDEFGFQLLQEWRDAGSVVAVVFPGTRLVRLRSVDSLQPLTLSRVDR